ncbi:MAG: hypothetical protein AB1705_09790, partial [Verrucomicrobiota bacterium]
MNRLTCLLALLVVCPFHTRAADTAPHWIWATPSREQPRPTFYRHTFTVPQIIQRAELRGVADFCSLAIYLNGQLITNAPDYGPMFQLDVTRRVQPGANVLAVRANASPGPSAFFLKLSLTSDAGSQSIATDSDWLATTLPARDWQSPVFQPQGWQRAISVGRLAPYPWGDNVGDIAISPLDNYEQWQQAKAAGQGTDPGSFLLLPGFQVELLRSAAPDEDSWVSMAIDPQGRIIIAKEKQGLLRVTLPKGEGALRVETINDTLQECRGLLFAHDSLYVNANVSKGFFRLRDTNGDDQFDEVKQLVITRAGGHGRNDLALGPDNKIYFIHGDDVSLPDRTYKLPPPIFTNLFPGEKFTHGHLIRTDADAAHWELVSAGLRNPYGVDFNPDGEAFTYDADAEHDMGAPWYRPTRVRHLVSGADFGWRRVTGQWPPYYVDHIDEPPLTVHIGKGSPTAVKFGTRSQFPPAYRRALFILDWTYGRIIAVHLAARGASYAGRAETFLRGR